MRATLKDVAKRANVSFTLVSKYLNGNAQARMCPQTRLRIDEAIAALHYRPSETARSLRRGKSRLLGLVTGSLTNEFFAHFADVSMREAVRCGFQLLLALCEPGAAAAAVDSLRERGVDSILLNLPPGESADAEKLGISVPKLLRQLDLPMREALQSFSQRKESVRDTICGVFFHKEWESAFLKNCRELSIPAEVRTPPIPEVERAAFLKDLACEAHHRLFFDGWQTAGYFLENAPDCVRVMIHANCAGPFLSDRRIVGVIRDSSLELIRKSVAVAAAAASSDAEAENARDGMEIELEEAFIPRNLFDANGLCSGRFRLV